MVGMLYCQMDWNKLKKFKNQLHLVRKAVEETSQKTVSFNISYDENKGIAHSLGLPPENEIVRFSTVIRPLATPSGPLYFKDISSMLLKNNAPQLSIPEKERLEKEIQEAEAGLMLLKINEEPLSASDLYLMYSDGEFFSEIEPYASRIREFKKNPLIMQYLLFQFYSYSCDVYRICKYLYSLIKEAEKLEGGCPPANSTQFIRPKCIYCLTEDGSFKSEEHIYPESLGNTEIILPPGHVCDKCNNGILSDLDNNLVEHDAISFLRVLYVPYNTKTGKLLKARYQNLTIEKKHPRGIFIKQPSASQKGFNVKENKYHVKINLTTIGRKKFDPQLLGRSLYNIALGIICRSNGSQMALDKRYDRAREFILGKRSFPNSFLMGKHVVPSPKVEGTHFILNSGTPFEMKIFGIVFFFNLEPEPVIQMNPELEKMNMQCFSLFDGH